MIQQNYDIMIVGAGMTGLTFAALMAEQDCHIAILDHLPPCLPELTATYDLRVSAINHASQMIFQSLGIWEEIVKLRISSYRHMTVWDENSRAQIDFDCTEVGQPYLGHIIEQSAIKIALLNYLKTKTNVNIMHCATPALLIETLPTIQL